MAKNKPAKPKSHNNPFKPLKGFVFSQETQPERNEKKTDPGTPEEDQPIDFADRMAVLGVRPLSPSDENYDESQRVDEKNKDASPVSEQDLFLEAMEALNVHFEDQFPDAEDNRVARFLPRRVKRLRKVGLHFDATLDLHGVLRRDVEEKMDHFLQNARHHGHEIVLVITGKGLHSEQGEPVVRQAVEEFLQHDAALLVAEWGRAPRQYGGDGALVVLLRKP